MRLVPTYQEIMIVHTLLRHPFAHHLNEVVIDPIHKLVLLKWFEVEDTLRKISKQIR
jgi:hypothetical protein